MEPEMLNPIESEKWPGFYQIPGFSNYLINRDGVIIASLTGSVRKIYCWPDWYVTCRLFPDGRSTSRPAGVHRLLALTFIEVPANLGPVDKLHVNHINGIKSDNRLVNLEWVTPKGNVHHAGLHGLSEHCWPVSVLNVDTSEVEKYPSCVECGAAYGLTKDAVLWRIKHGENRVYPERRRYRKGWADGHWKEVDVERELLLYGSSKAVLVRDINSGRVTRYEQLKDAAAAYGQAVSTLSVWLTWPDQPVHPPGIQIQWVHEMVPWREVEDLALELSTFAGARRVVARCAVTGEETVYPSLRECARAKNIPATRLAYRLTIGIQRVFKDGYSFGYVDPPPVNGRWGV